MANQDAARGDTGTNTTMNAGANAGTNTGRDHRSLIYVIAGSILALGLVLMAFYDRAGDSMPIAAAQKPVVTAQK